MADKFLCGISDLCDALGLSEAQVFNLARGGVVVKIARGQYDLVKSMRNYYEQRLDEAVGNPESLIEQRTRLTRYQADLAHLQLQQQRGEYLPLDLFKTWFQSMMSAIRSKLIALPSTLGDSHVIDDGIMIALNEKIREILTDASKTPMPSELQARLKAHFADFRE